MSDCSIKKTRENFASGPRSFWDQQIARQYDPMAPGNSYHSAPWPMQTTEYDARLKATYCPNCSSQGEIPSVIRNTKPWTSSIY